MDIMTVKLSPTLLKEIEEPTESLVPEGIFLAMLVNGSNRPPTPYQVLAAMYMLDEIAATDEVEARINQAILNGTVLATFDDELLEFTLFPAHLSDWWKVTMRYVINYLETIEAANEGREKPIPPDRRHLGLIRQVLPHVDKMVQTNALPTCYPWEAP